MLSAMKRDSLAHGPGGGKVWAAGVAYCLLYLAALTLLPRPTSALLRVVLGHLFLFTPAAVAAVATARAARRAHGSGRTFWLLLAGGSTSYAAAQVLFAFHEGVFPDAGGVRAAAHLGYYTCVVLLMVGLLVRPDRPRGPIEVRSAVVEWVMAAVGGYFLVVYFAILPRSDARYPWFLVVTAQEALPGLWALALALRVKDPPFHRVYRLLAFGLCTGAVFSVWPTWLYSHGRYHVYNPWDLAWALPFVPIAAAALGPAGPVWVRSSWSPAGDRHRPRLAVLSLAFPPAIDIACRVAGLQPALAGPRTELTLACSSILSLLMALRLLQAERLPAARDAAGLSELRAATGEGSAYLQFAAGVAHELNNPLMAVAGWAELAQRRGAPEPALERVLDATRAAAAAVARLQQLVRSGREPEARR
jgi:signal transduction histidine kinase